VSDRDEVPLGEDVNQLVRAVRKRRSVDAQPLHMELPVLVGDERPMMAVVWCQHRSERVRVARVEYSKIGLRDGLRLFCSGGRARGAVLRHSAGYRGS